MRGGSFREGGLVMEKNRKIDENHKLKWDERTEYVRELDFTYLVDKNYTDLDKETFRRINVLLTPYNQTISRIFNFDDLLLSLINQSLTLVKPSKWDDPYENFLLKSELYDSKGTKIGLDILENEYYGQCWTLNEDCDGLWRARDVKKDGVKVKSNVKKIMPYFYDFTNRNHYSSYFIAKVDYYDQHEIDDYMNNLVLSTVDFSSEFFLKFLLIKRMPFKYENELRLIFVRPNDKDIDMSTILNPWDEGDTFSFKCNLNDVLDEIEFNPWVSDFEFEKRKKIIEKHGYSGNIIKSRLYDSPKHKIKLNY